MRRSLESRFWEMVDTSGDCWVHSGTPSGEYPTQFADGKVRGAHRIAWELVAGPVPEGMWVLHICDNRACVRNDDEGVYELNGVTHPRRGHLFLGTYRDNIDDMVAKGRAPGRRITNEEQRRRMLETIARGEQNGQAKLTEESVREILIRLAGGEIGEAIAQEFFVSGTTIHHIRSGETWRHIPREFATTPPIPEEHILTAEAALILRVGDNAVLDAFRRGALKGKKIHPHRIVFHRAEVERYKRERGRGPLRTKTLAE